jgi:pseudomonalisin
MLPGRLGTHAPTRGLIGLIFSLLPLTLASAAGAAPAGPVARISGRIEESPRVELKGHIARALSASVDLGPADPALPVERVIMVLGASAAQEADLSQFLRNVQTRGRPEYHRWLTPEAFGRRFGVAPADLAVISSWLRSRGFRLEDPSPGRRTIVFSGNVGQLNASFGARMHNYRWHGERHLANSANPTIPQALSEVVRGFASLNDFRLRPQFVRGRVRPLTNLTNGTHALGPGDFAIIYDLTSSYTAGISGSGSTIAVIGRSDVQNVDINNFRSMFGLPASLPTVILAGTDPGLVADDQTESDLDLEWAGGTAPSAALRFVTAKSTSTTDGISLSSQYAVEQNVADVITVSYGSCETSSDVSGGTTFFNQLWQQAAAQGTSVFVSSGDSGAAGCDAPSSSTATQGPAVNQLCSSPYSTCAGGTEFVGDVSSPGTYWAAGNSATYTSAIEYIPEAVWNQSATVSGGSDLWASGGGVSLYYAKPAWQLSTGVPSDGRRDLPDVALNASSVHDPYLIYSSDGNPSSTLEGIGGTSAAAPNMAAIAALVVQRQNGRVGSFNPVLYGLSMLQAGGGGVVFHQITSGNNTVPGQTGFSASTADPVYNQASGLGSIDGGALLAHWNDFAGPTAGLAPASVVLPATVSVGSATLTLPSTTSWSAAVGGGGSGWLTVTPGSGTGSAPLTYAAAANTAATSRTGTITIDGQVLTVTQAAASGSSQIVVSSSTLSFGSDQVGLTTPAQRILVSNTGGSALTLGTISITGSAQTDYGDSGSCVTGLMLAAGASCFLQVTFDPTAAGARSATLQLGSTSIALSGTGENSVAGDGPLPLWSYAMLAVCLMLIAASRNRVVPIRRRP